MSKLSQDRLWLKQEGNRWFQRNKSVPRPTSTSPTVQLVKRSIKPGQIGKLLEIGCSDGRETEALARALGASAFGIDPSSEAVSAGNSRLSAEGSDVTLIQGLASNLPFEAASFDLLVLGFFLYIEDRAMIFGSISEADRVLKQGGYMAIVDFDFGRNVERPYKHDSRITTFKADYASWLVGTGHYHLVSKQAFSHDSDFFETARDLRVAASLLFKEPEPYA